MQSLVEGLSAQQTALARDSIAAEGARLRAEAQARQIPIELRELAIRHSESLKQW